VNRKLALKVNEVHLCELRWYRVN